MDELKTFAALRPVPPSDLAPIRQAARDRLDKALADSSSLSRLHRTRSRRILLAVGVMVVVAASIAVPIMLPAATSRTLVNSAWAIEHVSSGTIKVTFKDASNTGELQHALRADGVAAYVRRLSASSPCAYRQAGQPYAPTSAIQRVLPPPVSPDAVVIHSNDMPRGTAILIQVYAPGPDSLSVNASLMGNNRPPTCVPFAPK